RTTGTSSSRETRRAAPAGGGPGLPSRRGRPRTRPPVAQGEAASATASVARTPSPGGKGKVVGARYHVRPLTTPRQMRTSMVYVLLNFRKHLRAPAGVDPRSSGPHFSGWGRRRKTTDAPPATVPPETWMARVGWRRAGGPLGVEE